MYPSKPGLWQLETEIGFNQQKGMQTLFLVLDNGTNTLQHLEFDFLSDTDTLLCCVLILKYRSYVSSKIAIVRWVYNQAV